MHPPKHQPDPTEIHPGKYSCAYYEHHKSPNVERLQKIVVDSARDCGKREHSESETWEEIEVYEVTGCAVGLNEEEDLTYERNPGGTDKRIDRNEDKVPDQIRDRYDKVDL